MLIELRFLLTVNLKMLCIVDSSDWLLLFFVIKTDSQVLRLP